ncbi:F-box domain-containing protein [Entamoeba marina]
MLRTNPCSYAKIKKNDIQNKYLRIKEFEKELKLFRNINTIKLDIDCAQFFHKQIQSYDRIVLTSTTSSKLFSIRNIFCCIVELNVFIFDDDLIDFNSFPFLRKCRIEFVSNKHWASYFPNIKQRLDLLRIKCYYLHIDHNFVEMIENYSNFNNIIIQLSGNDKKLIPPLFSKTSFNLNTIFSSHNSVCVKQQLIICSNEWLKETCDMIILPFEGIDTFWWYDIILQQQINKMLPVSLIVCSDSKHKMKMDCSCFDQLQEIEVRNRHIKVKFPQHLVFLKRSKKETNENSKHKCINEFNTSNVTSTKIQDVIQQQIDTTNNFPCDYLFNSTCIDITYDSYISNKTLNVTSLHLCGNIQDTINLTQLSSLTHLTVSNITCENVKLPHSITVLIFNNFHNHSNVLYFQNLSNIQEVYFKKCKTIKALLPQLQLLVLSCTTLHIQNNNTFKTKHMLLYHSRTNYYRQNKNEKNIITQVVN